MFPLKREQIYSHNNKPRLLSLIHEFKRFDGDDGIFTLRDQKEGFESLQVLFINLTVDDPTETVFAETIFGDVYYWLQVRELGPIKEHLDQWREVAATKRKAKAYEAIIDEVKTRGKSAFSAAKYLIDEPYKDKRNPKVKEEVERTKDKARALHTADLENLKDYLDEQKSFPN